MEIEELGKGPFKTAEAMRMYFLGREHGRLSSRALMSWMLYVKAWLMPKEFLVDVLGRRLGFNDQELLMMGHIYDRYAKWFERQMKRAMVFNGWAMGIPAMSFKKIVPQSTAYRWYEEFDERIKSDEYGRDYYLAMLLDVALPEGSMNVYLDDPSNPPVEMAVRYPIGDYKYVFTGMKHGQFGVYVLSV